MHILLDTTPINNGHAHRGIGMYTSQLAKHLLTIKDLTVSFTQSEARSRGKQLELVHYPYFDLFQATLPLLKPAKKSVVTIHDVIPLELQPHYPVGIRGKLSLARQQLALKSVDAIITDSIYSKTQIQKYLTIPESRIHVVYLAGNSGISQKPSSQISAFKKSHHLPEKFALYVGDINYNKNIPQLIKALKFLPEYFHLVLAGKNFKAQEIPEWQWIDTQMALSDVTSRVHFISSFGEDADEFLSLLYSSATVYVQPSLSEGFGLPVLEALQTGCPVVSSNRGSLPEVGGKAVILSEPTAELLSHAIHEVLSWSDAKRKQRSRAGMEWASKFSWETTAIETHKVYESLFTA